MALNTKDLQAIDKIVSKRVKPLQGGQKKLDKKIDKLFNYLDKDVSTLKRKVATRLGINVSELS
jgi:hypothetical protein